MTDLTDEAVKSLLDGATPGPWRADGEPWNRIVWSSADNRVCFMAHSSGLNDARDTATSNLVAAAPDLARALLDARAELARVKADAAAAQALVGTLTGAAQRLNAACDAMWNDHRRVEAHRIKECHMKAISEAQQALFPALAQTPTDPGDGWTWNERLGWIGPDGKPADPRRG